MPAWIKLNRKSILTHQRGENQIRQKPGNRWFFFCWKIVQENLIKDYGFQKRFVLIFLLKTTGSSSNWLNGNDAQDIYHLAKEESEKTSVVDSIATANQWIRLSDMTYPTHRWCSCKMNLRKELVTQYFNVSLQSSVFSPNTLRYLRNLTAQGNLIVTKNGDRLDI